MTIHINDVKQRLLKLKVPPINIGGTLDLIGVCDPHLDNNVMMSYGLNIRTLLNYNASNRIRCQTILFGSSNNVLQEQSLLDG